MSFYIQPPVFAVQPVVCQPVAWVPTPTYTVVQPVPVQTIAYTAVPSVAVYTVPVVSASALPNAQSPNLRVRIIYYGHERGPDDAHRPNWLRATDAVYVETPARSRLRGDITRCAGSHNLRGSWRHARIFVMASGSTGPAIDSVLGPIMDERTAKVMDLYKDRGVEGEVAKEELKRVLEASLGAGQCVFATVCVDEPASLENADGSGPAENE